MWVGREVQQLMVTFKKIYQLRDPQTLEDAIRYGYLWYKESAESGSGFQLLLCQLQRFIVGFTKRDQERMYDPLGLAA